MASVGDIIRITHNYTYLAQEVKNVFFYRIASATVGNVLVFSFLDEYTAQFQLDVLNRLSPELTLDTLSYENLTDGLDIAEYVAGVSGVAASPALPSFVALNVKLLRDNKLTRNGSKRFAGLVENKVTDNTAVLTAGDIAGFEQWCGNSKTFVDYDGQGNSVTIQPVIVGRSIGANGKYQLDLTRVNDVIGAQVDLIVSTQNSRKQ